MKLKEGFILRTIAGENVAIPSGNTMNLNGMIRLNETGVFLWKQLQKECTQDELVAALLGAYEVEEATAQNHVELFVQALNKNGFLE